MAEENKEKWLNWLALSTLIFSAAATLGSFKGGGYSGLAMMSQNLASDQWAFYQAKSIKQHTYDLERDLLRLQIQHAPEAVQPKYQETIDRYTKEIERYTTEKKEIEAKARGHEKTKTEAQRYGGIFGKAVLYLQVAIMLAALGALLKKKPLWIIGLVPGVVGLVYFANGFWLFF